MLSRCARQSGGGATASTRHIQTRRISTRRNNAIYASTLSKLKIGAHTRVIVQGFTGRNATANSQESIEWGTKIVGGVVPSSSGSSPRAPEHLGRPLFSSVRAAMEAVKPDATAVYVPANLAFSAIEEAIEAEVPLIVAVAEHIPVHDMLRIHEMLRSQDKSRLVGPNSPGIINVSPGNKCRIGFQPLSCYREGSIGIVARSGTLSYETAASTTRAGLGQSLCVGVGGDMLPGTDMDEALGVVLADENTRGVALVGEIGGDAEVRCAELIEQYHARTPEGDRKPIAFLLAGYDAPEGYVMGHAGAFWQPGDPTLETKCSLLQEAGAIPVNHPSEFGSALASLLDGTYTKGDAKVSSSSSSPITGAASQMMASDSKDRFSSSFGRYGGGGGGGPLQQQQIRKLHLDSKTSRLLWYDDTDKTKNTTRPLKSTFLSLCIDRANRELCVLTCKDWADFHTSIIPHTAYTRTRIAPLTIPPPTNGADSGEGDEHSEKGMYDARYREARDRYFIGNATLDETLEALGWTNLEPRDPSVRPGTSELLKDMALLHSKHKAKSVTITSLPPNWDTRVVDNDQQTNGIPSNTLFPLQVTDLSIDLDDAAYRRSPTSGKGKCKSNTSSNSRSPLPPSKYTAYEAIRSTQAIPEESRQAERHGLVYHRLYPLEQQQQQHSRHVGIVVNGAGLAMNTVDELKRHGIPAANFLDTGGLATSATVHKSIEITLMDKRVQVIFVNIFGGLTKGDMIARGILQALEAFAEAGTEIPPLVVRIQGTLEEEGRRLLREEGGRRFEGKLFTYGDFHEALGKVQEFVRAGWAATEEV